MTECEVFLHPLDLNPIAKCLYAQRQWFRTWQFSLYLRVFHLIYPLCNTQQSYSPPRRRGIVRSRLENLCDWIGQTVSRKTRSGHRSFSLLGERIKGEGERSHKIKLIAQAEVSRTFRPRQNVRDF